MKYHENEWVIFKGKPHQITCVYEYVQAYDLFSYEYPEADDITVSEDEIETIPDVPSFQRGEMVIVNDKLLPVEDIDCGTYLVDGYFQTPFKITKINY
jgi:hypothetical protein